MNAVTQAAPASASSSEAIRVPTLAPEQGSATTASAQPFTDILSEQTSKASQDGLDKLGKLDKGELATGVTPKSAKKESPTPGSKKSVALQASTQLVPLVVPVVPMVTLDVAEVAPVRSGATGTVHPLMEMGRRPSTTQVGVAADAGLSDSKPAVSPLEMVDTSIRPGLGETSLSGALPTQEVPVSGIPAAVAVAEKAGLSATVVSELKSAPVSREPSATVIEVAEKAGLTGPVSSELKSAPVASAPSAKLVEVADNAEHVGAGDRPAASALAMGSTNPAAGQRVILAKPSRLGSEKLVQVGSEAHSSQPIPAGADVGAKPEHLRDTSVHSESRFAEPAHEPASSPLLHSQHSTAPLSPMPASSISALVSGASLFSANATTPIATTPIAQSMPHSLDVGGLAGAISRPLTEGNGSYTVVIAMHPADLGHVQAVVTLHGNDLQVSITPQTHVGRDALANAVDALKDELSHGGVNVNVTLHDPGSQSRGEDRPATTALRGESFSPEEAAPFSPPPPGQAGSQIHLIL